MPNVDPVIPPEAIQKSLDTLSSPTNEEPESQSPEQPKRRLAEVVGEAFRQQEIDNEVERLMAVGDDAPMAKRVAARVRLADLGYQ